MRPTRPLLDLQAFILLLFAAMVGSYAGALTYMSTTSHSQSLLASGAAAGAALLWGNSLLGPSDED